MVRSSRQCFSPHTRRFASRTLNRTVCMPWNGPLQLCQTILDRLLEKLERSLVEVRPCPPHPCAPFAPTNHDARRYGQTRKHDLFNGLLWRVASGRGVRESPVRSGTRASMMQIIMSVLLIISIDRRSTNAAVTEYQ